MTQQLLFLELNEVNFEFIRGYCSRGLLPNFASLLTSHQLVCTTSETVSDEIEPWIQWVTAHTGLPLSKHGIFRLGDIVSSEHEQIWEALERSGLRVGAVSPMNAKYRLRAPAFFVPDPWTATTVAGPRVLKLLYEAVAQAVSDNAQAKLTPKSAAGLIIGLLRYAQPKHYREYATYAATAAHSPWRKAVFLDRLLADVFMREVARTQPHFASLFLNAAAHIQHHYMFCSPCYDGPHRNPTWYVRSGADPVLEVYESYDRLVGEIRKTFPGARLMLATGLHQVPHRTQTFYWRLKDHGSFLRMIGVDFARCEPRMSRDFLVVFDDATAAAAGAARLSAARTAAGEPLFETDNRGSDVFVTLTYAQDIGVDFEFSIEGRVFSGLRKQVAFVALKNGEHDGVGYFVDTGHNDPAESEMPLTKVPERVAAAFGLRFAATDSKPSVARHVAI